MNKVLYGVQLKPRIIIPPKKTLDVTTPQGRADAERAVRRVMNEHRDVIAALAFR